MIHPRPEFLNSSFVNVQAWRRRGRALLDIHPSDRRRAAVVPKLLRFHDRGSMTASPGDGSGPSGVGWRCRFGWKKLAAMARTPTN